MYYLGKIGIWSQKAWSIVKPSQAEHLLALFDPAVRWKGVLRVWILKDHLVLLLDCFLRG